MFTIKDVLLSPLALLIMVIICIVLLKRHGRSALKMLLELAD
jgi:hypothetical protein